MINGQVIFLLFCGVYLVFFNIQTNITGFGSMFITRVQTEITQSPINILSQGVMDLACQDVGSYFDNLINKGLYLVVGAMLTKYTFLCRTKDQLNHSTIAQLSVPLNDVHQFSYSFPYKKGSVTAEKGITTLGMSLTYTPDSDPESQYIPVVIYTIVANGWPFIAYHLKIFKESYFYFQWHIIEGIAAGRADSKKPYSTDKFDESIMYQGISNDGTSVYINKLKEENPLEVFVHRTLYGQMWKDKITMLKTLHQIEFPCIMIEIDVDEIWSTKQLERIYELFNKPNNNKRCMYFHCHYFITPNHVTITPDLPTHQNTYEWIRAWKYDKGDIWTLHAPPHINHLITGTDKWMDVFGYKCFRHFETEMNGLVFTHYSYTEESVMKFKEQFYGRPGLVEKWKYVSKYNGPYPFEVSQYFSWLQNGTYIDIPERDYFGKDVPINPYPREQYDLSLPKLYKLDVPYYNIPLPPYYSIVVDITGLMNNNNNNNNNRDNKENNNNKEENNNNNYYSNKKYGYYNNQYDENIIKLLQYLVVLFPRPHNIYLILPLRYDYNFMSKFTYVWDKEGNFLIPIIENGVLYGNVHVIYTPPEATENVRMNTILSLKPHLVIITSNPYDFDQLKQIYISVGQNEDVQVDVNKLSESTCLILHTRTSTIAASGVLTISYLHRELPMYLNKHCGIDLKN